MYNNLNTGMLAAGSGALLPKLGGESSFSNIITFVLGILFIVLALTQVWLQLKKRKRTID